MKIFFVNGDLSNLADDVSTVLMKVREELLGFHHFEEVFDPKEADALIIQEKSSFKNFRYIKELIDDPLISNNLGKVYTINTDDCATGLLRGLYTSIPKSRFDQTIHVAVPYMEYPNELVFEERKSVTSPQYLASWRGNPKSSDIRRKILRCYESNQHFNLENTDSWLNHSVDEKKQYVEVILNAKFSLCPTGWAPVSFRIYESMTLGRCPVIIADQFVPPTGPDWRDFALFCPETKIGNLSSFLLEREQLSYSLGEKARNAWDSYFSSDHINQYYADSLISLIRSTPKVSKVEELRRWRSFRLQWSNKWTMLQRARNKIRNIRK